MAKQRPLFVWDEAQLVEDEVKHRVENWQDFGYESQPTEEAVRTSIYEDQDWWRMEWEYLLSALTEYLQKFNPNGYWAVEGKDLGWQRRSGYKYFRAETGQQLLDAILPETDCTFRIYRYGRRALWLHNFHHDAPTGESYYIHAISARAFEKQEPL